MKYDELNALMIEFDRLRLDADRVIRKLRALGVTDLPGDAPNHSNSSNGSVPVLPMEPTEEMVEAGRCRDAEDDAYGAELVRKILRAALAVAPRAEIPEVTTEMVVSGNAADDCRAGEKRVRAILEAGLARWVERMGQS